MKKIFFVGIICLFLQANIKAQTPDVHFGLKAGVNFSTIKISDGDYYDSKTGFHVGGLAHIHVAKHFAIQPEVLYSTQGANRGSTKHKENYINVPVLGQYMTNTGFRLQTGPQVGFVVSAKSETGDVEVDIKDQVNTVEFGWSFGASYICKFGFGLDARYNLGISNITETESVTAKNRVFQVGAFYQFQH